MERTVALPDLNRLPPSVAKTVIDHIQALIEQFAPQAASVQEPRHDMPQEAWVASHRAWLDSLPLRPTAAMDDSRESIYGGRGE